MKATNSKGFLFTVLTLVFCFFMLLACAYARQVKNMGILEETFVCFGFVVSSLGFVVSLIFMMFNFLWSEQES